MQHLKNITAGNPKTVEQYQLTKDFDVVWFFSEDGKNWWVAFTSFEEELKGGGSVKSTFLTDIDKLFELTLQTDEIEGVILNPWNRTIMLDKYLIEIILGKTA